MTKTRYAAYDHAAIYAIADTPERAVAQARRETMKPTARFSAKPIAPRLEALVAQVGGNVVFDDTGDALDLCEDHP